MGVKGVFYKGGLKGGQIKSKNLPHGCSEMDMLMEMMMDMAMEMEMDMMVEMEIFLIQNQVCNKINQDLCVKTWIVMNKYGVWIKTWLSLSLSLCISISPLSSLVSPLSTFRSPLSFLLILFSSLLPPLSALRV